MKGSEDEINSLLIQVEKCKRKGRGGVQRGEEKRNLHNSRSETSAS